MPSTSQPIKLSNTFSTTGEASRGPNQLPINIGADGRPSNGSNTVIFETAKGAQLAHYYWCVAVHLVFALCGIHIRPVMYNGFDWYGCIQGEARAVLMS